MVVDALELTMSVKEKIEVNKICQTSISIHSSKVEIKLNLMVINLMV